MRLTKPFAETEMAFIREFACGELYRLASMNPLERQERIRVAIMTSGLPHKLFADTGISYAQAYRMAYKKPCEMRRFPRGPEPITSEDETEENLS